MLIDGKRALAYIAEIDEIRVIDGYDRVEHARVGGWWVIVSKTDNFKPGDKCVYFEVDSKLPDDDERFSFLMKRNYKVKTIKMCGVYSQGLIMPLHMFPELQNYDTHTDVTEKLRVKYSEDEDNKRKSNRPNNPENKYKAMARRNPKFFSKPIIKKIMKTNLGKRILFVFFGKKKDKDTGFPTFIKKTDEERCLTGDTWITTDRGTLKLQDIVENKLQLNVRSVDADGVVSYKPVIGWQKYKKQKTIRFLFNATRIAQTIYATPDHQFLTDSGYKRADEICFKDSFMTIRGRRVGDEVILDLAPVPIAGISNGGDKFVYDITVADNHNFLGNGIISHNCENMPWLLEDRDTVWLLTEKLDGTSMTYALKRDGKKRFEFYVCSRNVRLFDNSEGDDESRENIYWDMAKKYNIEANLRMWLETHPEDDWVCIQGEGIGNVQGNPLKLDGNDLRVFNFITSSKGRFGSQEGSRIINLWGMKWVPIIGCEILPDSMETLKLEADGTSLLNPNVMREGIVYRTFDGERSFKNVSRQYLLKKKE